MINNICFFDTETNGKALNFKAPMKEVDNWPRVAQLAWRVVTPDRQPVSRGNFLIKPDGWVIPDQEQFFIDHNMSTARCEQYGIPAPVVLGIFVEHIQTVSHLVAHNMNFDYNVLGAEMLRYKVFSNNRPARICTMEASTKYCRIPHAGRSRWSQRDHSYKWPKLEELHLKLFGKDFDNKHDADGDIAALEPCFFELVARGVIVLNS